MSWGATGGFPTRAGYEPAVRGHHITEPLNYASVLVVVEQRCFPRGPAGYQSIDAASKKGTCIIPQVNRCNIAGVGIERRGQRDQ